MSCLILSCLAELARISILYPISKHFYLGTICLYVGCQTSEQLMNKNTSSESGLRFMPDSTNKHSLTKLLRMWAAGSTSNNAEILIRRTLSQTKLSKELITDIGVPAGNCRLIPLG